MYSHIVVGGGSAGAVMASRLSAKHDNRVLLIEAGPDTPPGAEPKAILDSYPGTAYLDRRFLWNDLRVSFAPPGNDGSSRARMLRRYEQGRVMGGGSSINGQLANRGLPWDYDEWEARGAAGWGWSGVLPYFRKLETDLDFAGPLHGQEGPLPIRRVPRGQWPGHALAFSQALSESGLPWIDDQNASFEDGHFPLTISNINDHRVSAAMAWLTPSVRARSNLEIRTGVLVEGLLFDEGRAIGVEAAGEAIEAGEVVLCAGALRTPEILLRSGIGPGADLQALGLTVRAHSPGVGRGLTDHPTLAIVSYLARRMRLHGQRRHIMLGFRFSSDPARFPPGDMVALVTTKAAWHAVGERLGTVAFWINRPASEAGSVRLVSPDPATPAAIDFNLLSDSRDVERLKSGFRRIGAMHGLSCLNGVISDSFPASYSEKVRQIGSITLKNRILTELAGLFLDAPAGVRRAFLDRFVREGETLASLMTDDGHLDHFVRTATSGCWHATSSCRMGAPENPMAVVNPDGKVKGVGSLRIADASVFPAIPSANTNLPVLMTAEKIAASMVGEP